MKKTGALIIVLLLIAAVWAGKTFFMIATSEQVSRSSAIELRLERLYRGAALIAEVPAKSSNPQDLQTQATEAVQYLESCKAAVARAGKDLVDSEKCPDVHMERNILLLEYQYAALMGKYDASISFWESLANNPGLADGQRGTIAKQISTNETELHDLWLSILKTNLGIYSLLLDTERMTKAKNDFSSIQLTKADVDKLKTCLVQSFGPSVKTTELTNGQNDAALSMGKMAYSFVNQGWPTVDTSPDHARLIQWWARFQAKFDKKT
ncbi:hypothetical protein SAMN05444156_2182 [Verrucomicrobium sp. GAS474]|uniref:hypothetical protein n=1 Tax=Verrucomicrobium sp. GAS474 TaxID=1882831 RepID=UPI00087D5A95|nr:hypothetical protein [Verrucomicrobium sp. GAS474]SDU13753.1 hypothetical protein SAMN05444156_2182 [Verrucomicrobium sp. GAS474]